MASVSGPGISVNYEYDADGRKVKETSGGATKQYLVDRLLLYGQVVVESDGSGNLNAEYVYGLERVSQERGGVRSYFLADGQGSVRQLTDSVGNVTDTYDFTAFGETFSSKGTTVNAFRYVGEQADPNTGFYYLRARWMDPGMGRFASVDPRVGELQSPIGLHRYLYANASPVNFRDPTGKFSLVEVAVVSSILGAAGGGLTGAIAGGPQAAYRGAIAGAFLGPVMAAAVTAGGIGIAAAAGTSLATGITISNTVALSIFGGLGLREVIEGKTDRERAAAAVGLAIMVASSGASFATAPKQLTILGSLKDCAAVEKIPGFNVLQGQKPNATEIENVEWLQSAMDRDDLIMLRTNPAEWKTFMESIGKQSRFVGIEMPMLESATDYVQIGPFFVKKF